MFILFSEEYDTFTIFRGFARHPHEIRRVLVHVIPRRTIQQYIILFLEQVKDTGIRRPLVNRYQPVTLGLGVYAKDFQFILIKQLKKGFPIRGLENFKGQDRYYVFHAGTKKTDAGIVTNGGRVLGVTAKGEDLKTARANAYDAVQWIDFENKYYRHDIGKAIDEA